MAEPVFRTLESLTKVVVAAAGTKITYIGEENIPEHGGAVIAINHTSYVDWLPAALMAHHRGRRMRFMIKTEMEQVKVVSYLIRHTGTIPVDRRAGAGSPAAVSAFQRCSREAVRFANDAWRPLAMTVIVAAVAVSPMPNPRATIGHTRISA